MAKAPRTLRNITLTLDERTAGWLRRQAAKSEVSVSRLVGDFVHERMSETQDYNEAMRQFLSVKPFHFERIPDAVQMSEETPERPLLRAAPQAGENESGG